MLEAILKTYNISKHNNLIRFTYFTKNTKKQIKKGRFIFEITNTRICVVSWYMTFIRLITISRKCSFLLPTILEGSFSFCPSPSQKYFLYLAPVFQTMSMHSWSSILLFFGLYVFTFFCFLFGLFSEILRDIHNWFITMTTYGSYSSFLKTGLFSPPMQRLSHILTLLGGFDFGLAFV